MLTHSIRAGAVALFISSGAVQATPIDLTGFTESSPSYEGAGDVVYDSLIDSLLTDYFYGSPIGLDDFAGSEINLDYDFGGIVAPFADISYDPLGTGDFQNFNINAFGYTDTSLEFLLVQDSADLSGGSIGVGTNAILRMTSQAFDFSGSNPQSFFNNGVNVDGFFEASVDLTLTALSVTPPPPQVVPLPAALPMLLASLGGFGLLARRRKSNQQS